MNTGSQLLREYIEVLIEKIRTKKDVKGKFKVEEFKKLESYEDMLKYASHFLEELGTGKQAGSSRRAFIFSGSKVLKIAKNDAGVSQNEAEVLIQRTAPNAKALDVITKVHAHDPSYKWLLVDMAKIEQVDQVTADKFKECAGLSWPMFLNVLDNELNPDEMKMSERGRAFVKNVVGLVKDADLSLGDLMKLNHWGTVGDGRLVLIDFGFTVDVRDKEYELVTNDEGNKRWKPKDKQKQKDDEEVQKAKDALNAMYPKKSPRDVNTFKSRDTDATE